MVQKLLMPCNAHYNSAFVVMQILNLQHYYQGTCLLKRCSLVSSEFLLPSRKCLFSRISLSSDDDTHGLHLPSENAYLAHRHTLRLSLFMHTLRLSLFMHTRACAIALSLQYYTIAHIAPSPDTSCHCFKPSDTSSALATHPIA